MIVMTPGVCSGDPRIDGTRLRTRNITDRYEAGESIPVIAHDYDISTGDVEACIRFELKTRDPESPEALIDRLEYLIREIREGNL